MAASKRTFKVVAFASKVGERDVEVIVKAASIEAARAEAIKKEPSIDKHPDVRFYERAGWTRVR
jgi:hypothetical protein